MSIVSTKSHGRKGIRLTKESRVEVIELFSIIRKTTMALESGDCVWLKLKLSKGRVKK